ncbi:MAG: ABC transporter permease, partial [Chromatiaceae bacterium]|nr:ABC transporter permease [Chromatiaceae bacterium]
MPVLLLTDIFVLLLLGLMLAYGLYAARHEHLRAPWRRVVASRVGMMSLVVLGSYAAIGLLDTVHFHPRLEAKAGVGAGGASSEVLSLLDLWLAPLRERQEKTYSAPFATHLHAMETLVQPDGTSRRDYPRLVHGGAHLAAPEGDRGRDILMTSVSGLMKGLALWALVTMVAAALLAWRRRRGQGRNPLPGLVGGWGLALRDLVRGRTQWPWRTGLLTLGVILILGAVTAELAVKYHVLGTDKVGEDVLYQALKSIRTGLVIGTLTTLVMLPAAILLGIMAGYYRGLTDDVIQYLYTTLNSIPGVLLIAAAVLMLQVHMSNHEAE